ncbi:MAG: DMT family transporter [Alphaproteobacteria bacterium]|jgi:drug/metabolite transporter (DMT)-like permease|uniref:EamA family transporter n=1 Tax=Pacificispira sp. TaxID=2888761 RepID=UPI00296873E8|nr:DMT family transporter [Alphaproteobacteria bacterium]
MIGEAFALLSAAFFGLAGAAIAKGAPQARGDNGAFLSIVLTLLFAAIVWLAGGSVEGLPVHGDALISGVAFFVASGVLATVLGRLTNFKSIALAGAIRAGLLRRLIPVFSTILAVVILGERYGLIPAVGMGLILVSVALTLREKAPADFGGFAQLTQGRIRTGAMLGALCALFYALAYVARKLAMEHVPDAAFGAMVGAATGVVWYVGAAPFSRGFRNSLFRVLSDTGTWQWIAAISMSLGQLLLFFALKYTAVAVVAIIGTTEIFVGIYLAAFLLKTEPRPGRYIVAATILASIGVSLVALG